MAERSGLSQTAISRTWRAFGLQPRLESTCRIGEDPQCADKGRDVVGLYTSPPDHASVLCVAEKSQVRALDRAQPLLPLQPGQEIHLVMDNYATHNTPAVQRWFQRRTEYDVHGTPTSASWLNQIERFLAEITTPRIRRSAFHSVAALEHAIRDYLDEHDTKPRPLMWTATAHTTLERVANVCKRTSNSGR